MPESRPPVPAERIEREVLLLRGQKVILDHDLRISIASRAERSFKLSRGTSSDSPSDFMFQLATVAWSALRSQTVISKGHGARRYPPFAFTERGVGMLSSILRSPAGSSGQHRGHARVCSSPAFKFYVGVTSALGARLELERHLYSPPGRAFTAKHFR